MQKLFKLSLIATVMLSTSCAIQPNKKQEITEPSGPKNIILMVSDGIGFNGWLAADYYQGLAGQQTYQVTRPDGTKPLVFGLAHSALNLVDEDGNTLAKGADISTAAGAVEQGYDPLTRWQRFENAMLNDFTGSGSYTSYTDSAAAGTALMSGRKTAVGRVNMDWSNSEQFDTIAQIAMKKGLSAGTVTSVMVSHATPAAAVAHNVSRNNYAEIFNEMHDSGLSVIMGAGHPIYDASGQLKPQDKQTYKYVGGEQTYNVLRANEKGSATAYIESKSEFEALAQGQPLPERVVGIVRSGSTLQASRAGLNSANTPSGMAFNEGVPSLATMSMGALNVLNQDQDGFFAMIEGGAVDWMGHANNMPRFIEEQVDFNQAVDAVIKWVETNSSWDETLLIITSDHECGGIWGEGTWTNGQGGAVAMDRSKASLETARFNPAEDQFNAFLAVQNRGKGNIAGYQWASRNHTNELVPLWVLGKGADRFKEFSRTDPKAGQLWGEHYNWNGNYVDNTSVFQVMEAALLRSTAR
ncbi:alkaline phosphatase [Pseudoalteromonas luteoviolacea]|uniref:alkaline phosphatase n=1 Tax=Pseudoalteromonas luteoviolacea TaxID=43657 RepID=UPI001F17620C|nr:alkaline phosphatase [Pseudoalteromonas luteoviolacea]MCF6441765.1 alkaline phosphatase [Pseudoalteromonas luteoviolacea]